MRHATLATATQMKPWSDGNGSRIEGGRAVGFLRSRHDRHRDLDGPLVCRRPVRPALIEIRIGTKQTPGQSAHYQLSDCLVRSASFRFFVRLRLRPECASTQRFGYDILVATPMFGVNRPGANGRHATTWILLFLPDLWATSLGGAKLGGRPSGMRPRCSPAVCSATVIRSPGWRWTSRLPRESGQSAGTSLATVDS